LLTLGSFHLGADLKKAEYKRLIRELRELNSKTAEVLDVMTPETTARVSGSDVVVCSALQPRKSDCMCDTDKAEQHIYGNGVICATDRRGTPDPPVASPTEIVFDASEGYIPLWASGTTLRWRFNSGSMQRYFRDPGGAQALITDLIAEAIQLWDYACPVRFRYDEDTWDFEVYMMPADDCRNGGCVLASAFFPNGGRNRLNIYPEMFQQPRHEWIETLAHELGHVFGLRHFFADVTETQWRSEIFGSHSPFSIMNYGHQSIMTDLDRADLSRLYELVWDRRLTAINGTPIRLMVPHHAAGAFVR